MPLVPTLPQQRQQRQPRRQGVRGVLEVLGGAFDPQSFRMIQAQDAAALGREDEQAKQGQIKKAALSKVLIDAIQKTQDPEVRRELEDQLAGIDPTLGQVGQAFPQAQPKQSDKELNITRVLDLQEKAERTPREDQELEMRLKGEVSKPTSRMKNLDDIIKSRPDVNTRAEAAWVLDGSPVTEANGVLGRVIGNKFEPLASDGQTPLKSGAEARSERASRDKNRLSSIRAIKGLNTEQRQLTKDASTFNRSVKVYEATAKRGRKSVSDRMLLDLYTQARTGKTVTSVDDVQRNDDVRSLFEKIGVSVAAIFKGEELPDDIRKDMLAVVRGREDNNHEFIRRVSEGTATQGEQMGVDFTPIDVPQAPSDTTPQTQADFDAMPSGTIYIDPDDGQRYRKP